MTTIKILRLNSAKLTNYLIIINLISLLILPQLNNVHYDPLPQFWAEMTFAWATVSLFLICCFRLQNITIPRITIPLLIFSIYLVIQPIICSIDFPGLSYIAALEFLICILAAISVSSIINQYGLNNFVIYLSIALLIGALLQSIIGFLQYSGLYIHFKSVIFYDNAHPTTNIFGHFGQRNHYCHYLSWATFALIYLYQSGSLNSSTHTSFKVNPIKPYLFYPLIAWFMFSMTIASSRSVFIYFALALIITGLYWLRNKTTESRQIFFLIICASITLFIFEYGYPLLENILFHNDVNSGLQRIASSSDSGFGRRLFEWKKAWIVFKEYPIFGYGFQEFAKQSVQLQLLFPNAPANDGLFTNCHNLVLQLLAETGIIGTTIILGAIIYSIYRISKNSSIESSILLCMIATTIAHSMLEYPLWYIYFLGPFIMFFATDKPIIKVNSSTIAAITALPIALLIYQMLMNSLIFNRLVNYNDTPDDTSSFMAQGKYLEKLSNSSSIWAYSALYSLDNYINLDDNNTNQLFAPKTQLQYENKFSNFHPYPTNMIKQAMLYWNLGDQYQAKYFVNLALIAFPVYKNSYLDSLKDKKYKPLYLMVKNFKYN